VSFVGEIVALYGREQISNWDYQVEMFKMIEGESVMHGSALMRGARGKCYSGLVEPVPIVAIKQNQIMSNKKISEFDLLNHAKCAGIEPEKTYLHFDEPVAAEYMSLLHRVTKNFVGSWYFRRLFGKQA